MRPPYLLSSRSPSHPPPLPSPLPPRIHPFACTAKILNSSGKYTRKRRSRVASKKRQTPQIDRRIIPPDKTWREIDRFRPDLFPVAKSARDMFPSVALQPALASSCPSHPRAYTIFLSDVGECEGLADTYHSRRLRRHRHCRSREVAALTTCPGIVFEFSRAPGF